MIRPRYIVLFALVATACGRDPIPVTAVHEVERQAAPATRTGRVRSIVHDYLRARREADWSALSTTLATAVEASASERLRYQGKEALVAAWRDGVAWTDGRHDWRELRILNERYQPGHGWLLYEARDRDNRTWRVAESIAVVDGRISEVRAVVSPPGSLEVAGTSGVGALLAP